MAFTEFLSRQSRSASLVIAATALFAMAGTGTAVADAGAFLKSIEGEWRGSGFYRFEGRQSDERISCRLTNTFDDSAGRLKVSGECATTQLKNSLQGFLEEEGADRVSGALMGSLDGSRMTKSTGSVKGNQLVVQANFVDNATGTLYRSQQVLRRAGRGFEADFYWYDNKLGKFVKSGTIKFTSR